MTGQQLRNSILQEAIHGRLVPNVLQPGEKSGELLRKDILAERQKKENEEKGKKAKKLTLSTIEEEPWELPKGWYWCKLPEMCEVQFGTRVVKKLDEGSTYFVYGGGGATFKVDSYNRENALLVSRFAMSKQCTRFVTGKFFLNDSGLSLLADGVNVLQSYLNYVIFAFNDTIYQLGRGAAQKNLNMDEFENLLLPLAPISIQRAIVEKIETLLPLIDEYDKAAVELETLNKILPDKLRKSVLQEAIHGTLVPNDIPEGEATGAELLQQILKERQEKENKEKGKKAKKLTLSEIEDDVEELPNGWCWCKLSDIGDCLYGVSESAKTTGPYKLLRITDIQNDSVNWDSVPLSDYKKKDVAKYYLTENDLVFARTGGTVGKSYLIQDVPNNSIYASYLIRVRFQGKALLPKYIKYFFQSPQYWSQIIENAEGTGQPNCNGTKLANLNIPLPPLSIQHRIVEKIEEVFSAINKLQA